MTQNYAGYLNLKQTEYLQKEFLALSVNRQ